MGNVYVYTFFILILLLVTFSWNSCYILENKLEKDVSKKHKSTFFQLRQKHVIIKFICQKLKEEMIIFLTLHNSSLCFRNNIRKNKRQSLKTILMLTCHLESKRKLPLTKTSDTRLIMLECYFTGDGWCTIKIIEGMYGIVFE